MLVWFSRKVDLAACLEQWERIGPNYDPDQPIDASWHVDSSETVLGPAEDGALFDAAVRRLFAAGIYPPAVLKPWARFIREGRSPQFGDRIIQRIRVIPGFLDVVTMNIVSSVWHEPDRRGFSVFSSGKHFEVGEWTASVTRRPGGAVSYMTHAISRPGPNLPRIAHGYARALQLRAQQLGPANFRASVRMETNKSGEEE